MSWETVAKWCSLYSGANILKNNWALCIMGLFISRAKQSHKRQQLRPHCGIKCWWVYLEFHALIHRIVLGWPFTSYEIPCTTVTIVCVCMCVFVYLVDWLGSVIDFKRNLKFKWWSNYYNRWKPFSQTPSIPESIIRINQATLPTHDSVLQKHLTNSSQQCFTNYMFVWD